MIKIAWHQSYCHPLPENHRFPMLKYDLIPEQLLYEGTIVAQQIFEPQLVNDNLLIGVHDVSYLQKLKSLSLTKLEQRKVGFPLSNGLVIREWRITQGTIDAALFALQFGIAFNVAGGTHHAFANRGEGFCMLNDQAVAANYLLQNNLAKKILIVDLDVHQGNGTAAIFTHNPNVFTFSMHGADNYPLLKEKSNLDIPLKTGTSDKQYLEILANNLQQITKVFEPDFVFYQAGVDVLATDKLGKLNLSIAACAERDNLVFNFCKQKLLPIVVCMGGGYSPRIADILEAHCNTYRLAMALFEN